MSFNSLALYLVGGGFFLIGLCVLIHICSKDQCSLKYESTKRKFEIHPHKDKPQTPKKTTFLE